MGKQIAPALLRSTTTPSYAAWITGRHTFADELNKDLKIRKYIQKHYASSSIASINIQRSSTSDIVISVTCVRPASIIGKKGLEKDALCAQLTKITGVKCHISVLEVKTPDLEPKVIAEQIAHQLEKRVMFRKAMKRAVSTVMRAGALGVRVKISGRLAGAEIARYEQYQEGQLPLQTIRSNITYALALAKTTYGILGVKVWINKR